MQVASGGPIMKRAIATAFKTLRNYTFSLYAVGKGIVQDVIK